MDFVAHQCIYGLETPGPAPDRLPMPAKKPTRFMSSSCSILQELSTRCDHSHKHQELMDGGAKNASEYPDALCRAICRGLANQKKYDSSFRVCTGNLDAEALSSLVHADSVSSVSHSVEELALRSDVSRSLHQRILLAVEVQINLIILRLMHPHFRAIGLMRNMSQTVRLTTFLLLKMRLRIAWVFLMLVAMMVRNCLHSRCGALSRGIQVMLNVGMMSPGCR